MKKGKPIACVSHRIWCSKLQCLLHNLSITNPRSRGGELGKISAEMSKFEMSRLLCQCKCGENGNSRWDSVVLQVWFLWFVRRDRRFNCLATLHEPFVIDPYGHGFNSTELRFILGRHLCLFICLCRPWVPLEDALISADVCCFHFSSVASLLIRYWNCNISAITHEFDFKCFVCRVDGLNEVAVDGLGPGVNIQVTAWKAGGSWVWMITLVCIVFVSKELWLTQACNLLIHCVFLRCQSRVC